VFTWSVLCPDALASGAGASARWAPGIETMASFTPPKSESVEHVEERYLIRDQATGETQTPSRRRVNAG
jgi:hypothetical protein